MSWCTLCRLLTRHYNKCLPQKFKSSIYQSLQQGRTDLSNRALTIQETRHFTTSRLCQQVKKPMPTFNEFYTAVEETNAKMGEIKLYKYMNLSNDATERDLQIKRWMFVEAVDLYVEKTATAQAAGLRRGHMDFITQALERMKDLGVHRDMACYKALFKVFPPGIMVPTSKWQREAFHYPKQQSKAGEILEQMEDNGVIPDKEFRAIAEARFGPDGHVLQKLRKMIYWMRKFQNTNPYQLPHHLPIDPIELAVLALKKMCVDLENEVKVFNVTDEDRKLFIASAQSPMQCEMIESHPIDEPLYVEGGYRIWLREKHLLYFTLRSDSDPKLFEYPTPEEQMDHWDRIETIFDSEEPKALRPMPNIHQQEDGTILSICITETSTKESLISWIRCLQDANPKLASIPIVFALKTPGEDFLAIDKKDSKEEKLQGLKFKELT